ncbi:glycoside hydrolase family 6 protein [Actinokineospora sp. UTMC 2448]|uniref:glycoside hydrolase family 6 protein n=1 Tax=Actinokineospora sp. UTMC 2448 TaxID=2268449 RepID=UPI002164886E|nr:glycoside hydrolase family 6 protein [Actinokineospora sp. UTMC 2448]UVS77366.1 Endoglucanase A precursor [Actinokineospora sp. UTMC 2448]
MRRQQWLAAVTAALALGAVVTAGSAQAAPPHLPRGTQFYVEPDSNAARQAEVYLAEGRTADAELMAAMAAQPQAIWFTTAGADKVRADVRAVVEAARAQHQVPVLVAYFVPYRDCSQWSAGGARSEQEYKEWIDAFAEGIGDHKAVVIVEPDGLALLTSEPWCTIGPDDELVPQRFREISHAVTALKRGKHTKVYLDAGHSAWQALNDYDAGYGEPRQQLGIVNRLLLGNIAEADGFALNTSNYRFTEDLVQYGTRVSKCLYLRERGAASCPSAEELDAMRVHPVRMKHFVLDTSRNGRGHYTPGDGETDWCNPPGRGLGERPTAHTGIPLVDAFVWTKRPGESDGECQGGPPAGRWWPEQALELARLAEPPLR